MYGLVDVAKRATPDPLQDVVIADTSTGCNRHATPSSVLAIIWHGKSSDLVSNKTLESDIHLALHVVHDMRGVRKPSWWRRQQ